LVCAVIFLAVSWRMGSSTSNEQSQKVSKKKILVRTLEPKTVSADLNNLSTQKNCDENVTPETMFVYLFDVSGSFNNRKANSPYVLGIDLFRKVLLALNDFPIPREHRVGTISSDSFHNRDGFICKIRDHRGIFKEGCSSEPISNQIQQCQLTLRRQEVSTTTDISGALDFASRTMQTSGLLVKGIIMFTDLEEDLGNLAASQPNLKGLCVLAYVNYPVNRTSNNQQRLEADWERKLRSFNAKDFRIQHFEQFSSVEIKRFFTNCAS